MPRGNVKRASTTRTRNRVAPTEVVGPLAFASTAEPANDGCDRDAALLALVDELAALAAKLFVSGRLTHEHSPDVRKAAAARRKNGV
jgi:hypothetical protein